LVSEPDDAKAMRGEPGGAPLVVLHRYGIAAARRLSLVFSSTSRPKR
jgi:hypothetical protein